MLQRFKAAGLFWPTLATLALATLLLSLGQWQWSRKAWKEGLIAAQFARAKAEPVALADALADALPVKGLPVVSMETYVASLNYRRVRLTGTFDHAGERHVYTPLGSGPGWQIMTPMLVPGQPALKAKQLAVYVDRGFVPDAKKAAESRVSGQAAGEVTLTGRIRTVGEQGRFTPDNDRAGNKWFWRDIKGMWGAKLEAGEVVQLSPYYVEVDNAASNPGGWPKPGMSDAVFNNLSNRHLEYALTWWALAATLAGMYAVFAWPKLRR
jgi:surfeit locus 1 family protein